MSPESWVTLVQEIGLAATLALVISLQLRRVIDNGRKEREQEREAFLAYLRDDSEANRDTLNELSRVLFELRGAILHTDLEGTTISKPKPPAQLTVDRAEAMARVKRIEEGLEE